MIVLQLTTPELLAVLFALAVLIFAGVVASYCLGAGSVNIDLELMRRATGLYRTQNKNQPHQRCSSPPPPPPPRRP